MMFNANPSKPLGNLKADRPPRQHCPRMPLFTHPEVKGFNMFNCERTGRWTNGQADRTDTTKCITPLLWGKHAGGTQKRSQVLE